MSEELVGHYEMLWDCEYCGSQGLLGLSHRHCPECGAVQDPERRYYPDDDNKVAVADHRFSGADQVCGSCDAASSAAATHCGNCGAALRDAKAAAVRREQTESGGTFAKDDLDRAKQERVPGAPDATAPKNTKKSKTWMIVLAVIAGIIAVIVLIALWRKPTQLTVTGVQWRRAIAIETLAEVRESEWRDRLPRGARVVSCKREKRSTKKIEDGETCTRKRRDKGDGTFEEVKVCKPKYRSEPVYDEKCSYLAQRWKTARSVDNQGTSLSPEPTWPTVVLSRTGTGLGAEREGSRTESYSVILVDKEGDSHECDVSLGRWKQFTPDSRWKGELRMVGGGLACDTLKAAR